MDPAKLTIRHSVQTRPAPATPIGPNGAKHNTRSQWHLSNQGEDEVVNQER